jgi:hypothetical protein
LTPLLQAETDRDVVRRFDAIEDSEKTIMGEDWQTGLKVPVPGIGKDGVFDPAQSEPVYYTKRYL